VQVFPVDEKKNVAWQALNSQHPVLRVKKEKKSQQQRRERGHWRALRRCRLGGQAVRRSRKKKPDAGDEARGKPAVGWRLASGARWSGSLQGGSGTE